MPFTLRCKKCGFLLFECKEDIPEPDWYGHVFYDFGRVCPGCKRELPNPHGYSALLEVEVEGIKKAMGKTVQANASAMEALQ